MVFFFSYARGDLDPKGPEDVLVKFYNALDRQIRELLGERDLEPGFRDQTIPNGNKWPDTIATALTTCKLLVAMYSPSFFNSDYCGKEWAVFSTRRKNLLDKIMQPSLSDKLRVVFPGCWIPLEP